MPDLEEIFTQYKDNFLFRLENRIIRLNSLGKTMDAQFLRLYESHFLKKIIDFSEFVEESLKFFDQNVDNPTKHDAFFSNFTLMWNALVQRLQYEDAENIWNMVLNIAYEWERKNLDKKQIHKGTPLYWWSVTCILNRLLEKGFLLMHQALEEDRRTHKKQTPDTPPFFFVTLNYEKTDQAFKSKVDEIAQFLNEFLRNYQTFRAGTLTLIDLKSKFLNNSDLQEIVFYFVFELFHLKELLTDIKPRFTQNPFSSLLQTNILFNLALIVDNVLKQKSKKRYLWDHLIFLSNKELLRFNQISGLGDAIKTKFENTLTELLNSKYTLDNGKPLTPIEEDFAVCYGFRNHGAHEIKHYPIINENFKDIVSRILNALFFSIEKLY